MFPLIDSYEDARSSVQLTLAARVSLRFPLSEDTLLIEQWLDMSDVQQSWGKPEHNISLLAAPRSEVDHRVIVMGNEPLGYLRWRPRAGTELRRTSVGSIIRDDAVQLDVLIGPRHRRSVGIGSVAISLAFEELVDALHPRLCFGKATVHHLASRRAFEKAGFMHHLFYDDPQIGPAVIMVRHAK
jgi:RimJ/RimL family protein N-acetyltransferase